VADVRSHLQSLLASHILSRFSSLSLDAWGEVSGNPSAGSTGQISLGDFDEALEPSPVAPSDSDAHQIFTGTIKQTSMKSSSRRA
jgi:hypothetical protein